MKDAAYVINLDEYYDIGTHWIAFYLLKIMLLTQIVFEVRKFLGNKNIITNIYRKQAYDSVICG